MGRFSRRSRSNRRKRALPRVSILARLFWGLVALIPPLVLCGMGGKAFLRLADRILAQSAPLVSAEASRQLQRPVTVGKITPDISLGSIWEGLLHRESLGTLPVGVYDVRLLNRPGKETREAGGPLLARVDSVTAFISLPTLLSGNPSAAVPRIVIKNPELVLVRDANNQFNVQNIVPKKPNATPSAPFQSFVRLSGGRLRFRDYSALRPKAELPTDNRFSNINGFADLLGARTIRFQIQTNAAPGSTTARHLGGILSAGGEAARGMPAIRPNAPAPESARFLVHLYVGDADATYWVPYFVKTPDFRVTSGRGDLNLALVAPRPPKPGQPIPGIGVTLGANVRNVGLYSPKLPAPLEAAYGRFNYNDGTLDFDAQARILGERVTTTGTMWDLTAPKPGGPLPKPQISVFLNAPRIPVERAVVLLTPKDQPLPPGLHIGGIGSLSGTLSGPTTNFVATGHISGLNVRQNGLPPVRNIAADLVYSGGLLGINNAVAFLEGGGQVRGRAAVRLDGLPVTAKGNAVFAVQGSDLNLAALSALKPFAKRPANDKLRFSGRGNVEVVGQRTSGLITAAANVSAQNLRVGDLPFPVARARVLVSGNAVSVPAARIESPAGIVSVSGNGNLDGTNALSAKWAVASLDVGRVAQIVGVQNARGLLSAHGAIGGTLKNPRLVVDELVALNLRYEQATDQPNLTRRFAIDSVQGRNILVTPQSVTLARPLTVRRFPTALTVGGSVSNLLPAKNQTANPRLNLYARLQNLDFAEVQRQLAAADRERLREAARNLPRALAPANTTDAPFGGLVKTANFRIVGTAKNPDVDGTVYLDRLFVGKYPIDSGSVLFSYNKNRVHVGKAKATASVGTIIASGDLFANGTVRGQFAAPDLDLAKVSFLTGTTPLGGRLSLRGTASGTTQKPNVSVSIDPSNVSVAEFALQNVTAQNARYIGGPNNKPGRIELPLLSFEQSGANVSLKNAVYNVQTGQVAGDFSAQTGDISALVSALRQSGLSDTDAGAAFTQALARLPSPLTGQFTLATQVRGSVVDAANGQKRFAGDTGTLTFTGEGVKVGEFRADTVRAVASLSGDTITLSELTAKTPSATIRGSGSYNIETSSGRALLETNEVSLDLVRSLPGLAAFPLYGTLSGATVSARMSRENGLSVTASTEGKNLVYVPPAPSTSGTQTAAEAAVAAVLNAPPPGSPQAKALANATSPANATQSAPAGQESAATADAVAANLPLRPGVTISSVRATVRLTQDAQKRATVSIDDFLVSRGAAELRVEGSLPLALNPDDPSVADRPISLRATVPQFAVANLLEEPLAEGAAPASGATNPNGAQIPAAKKRGNFLTNLFKKKTPDAPIDPAKANLPQLGGTAEATLTLEGTLKDPKLNGSLKIVDGQFRLPNPQNKSRDTISPVSDLDADVVIANSTVAVNTFRAELGGVNGKKGGYGTLDVGGTVTLDDLANLQNLLRPAQTGDAKSAATLTLGGSLNLRAKFDNFRPEEENLLQLGEAASGKINGTVLVQGALRAPKVTSENNQPVRVSDALLRLTSSQEQPAPNAAPKPIDPSFDIPVLLDGKAVVTNPSLFRFEANGQATVAGRLSDPNVSAVITTQGGYFNLPTARFRVQKDGIVRLRYNLNDGSVRAENIIAKARVYSSASGASLSSYAQSGVSPENNGLPPSVTSTQSVGGTATAYTITATINGPLNLLSSGSPGGSVGGSSAQSADQVNLQFTSDPALSSTEIVALLGTQQQVDQARNGNVEGAFRGIAQQALLSSYVPQYLSPFTQGIQNSLGLADLTLDYNPNGAAGIYAAKAYNRFLLEYNQTIATRSTTGSTQKQPYTYSVSYDLFRLRPNSLIQPRVQVGTSTNEQHIQTYFLRGKLIF